MTNTLMRLVSVFCKSLRQQTRDVLSLGLALAFAPCMVLLYWLFFPSGSTTYAVLVLNPDACAGCVEALQKVTYADGKPLLVVRPVADRAQAEARLRNRDAAVLLILPPNFAQAAAKEAEDPATLTLVGDLTNPAYAVAAALTSGALDEYLQATSCQPRAMRLTEEPLGQSAARTEFENYVPGLLIFAVTMLIFQAAMTVTREVEAGTLRRLRLTRMTALDFLGGTSAALALVGVTALTLALATAWALGFRSQGPLWLAALVGAITSLSVVGVGLVVACFSHKVTQAFLIANFPLALFMFFSGAIYPMPRVPLFTLAGHAVGLYDILPPTHAVVALNKVLTLGQGIGDIAYELAALGVLSLLYFAAGVWLFQRTHLQAD
jgi:ABC-2 type transport system permease protein